MGKLALKAASRAVKLAPAAVAAGKAAHTKRKFDKQVQQFLHPRRKEVVTMRKSVFISLMVALAAVAGALAAAFIYLRRREAELDEYEQLLFSEDFSHEEPSAEAENGAKE